MLSMKILFAASEVTPILKVGELADVVAALPRHLRALEQDVRVVIPEYSHLDPALLPNIPVIIRFTMPVKDGQVAVTVKQGRVPGTDVKLYLIGMDRGLSVPTVYPLPSAGDQDRFLLFSLAILEWLQLEDWQPDIIHLHDWATGLIPYVVRQRQLPFKTVMTIHDLTNQGNVARELFKNVGVTPPTRAKVISLLKTGISEATKVSTVSPTYAKEIITREYGAGLQAAIRQRQRDLSGILNGVDYAHFAPHADKTLKQDYTMKTVIESKIINKELLRKEVGLSASKQKPLFGMVSRIDGQKGLDLIEQLLKDTPFIEHAQLVILGTGSQAMERKLSRLAKKFKGDFTLLLQSDEALAHRIFAGSDFILVPSKVEPCGLAQMVAMKYGALPVVRRTGGLADTVIDITNNPTHGTGFVFDRYHVKELHDAVNRSLSLYQDKPARYATIETAMRQDFSWGRSAKAYLELYQKAYRARRRRK
jgi:starch synthase